jgi:hypothetical protein
LSLNPDGSKDSDLKIQELPNITVGDYTQISEPIVIPNKDIAEEIAEGSTYKDKDKGEDEDDITIDSSSDTDACFDDSDDDFDEEVDGDEEEEDCNMD